MRRAGVIVGILSALAFILGVGGMRVYDVIQQNNLEYQEHPIASLLGAVAPSIFFGVGAGWLAARAFSRSTRSKPHTASNENALPSQSSNTGTPVVDQSLTAMHSSRGKEPRKRKLSRSIGWRRLAIVVGISWITFCYFAFEPWQWDFPNGGWTGFLIIGVGPVAAIITIRWVVAGFRADKESS